MRALTSYLVFLPSLILSVNYNYSCLGYCFTEGYLVHISNHLSDNRNLSLHCWSGDDNLGNHELSSSAEFEFHFCLNIWGTTKFWCDFSWNHHQYGGIFKVFWVGRKLVQMCNHKNCVWSARDDGIYLLDIVSGIFVKKYIWEAKWHQPQTRGAK
ncbi:hypothetical protein MANES_09G050200v8 [Manihot esculenta]|uniref:S-protein homolog n=1 Tax=Manihot esculenta TaxID=3983 RepID=A0A2C9V821_MANES|nr:hypothetical protein MANES_09G050200v8 [Manihot esculenta]